MSPKIHPSIKNAGRTKDPLRDHRPLRCLTPGAQKSPEPGWNHMGCLGWQVQERAWIYLDLCIWYLGKFLISFSSQLDLYEAFRSLRIWFYNSFPWNWTVLWKIKSLHIFSIRNPSRLVQIDAWVPSLPPKSTNWLPSTAQALPLRRCNMGLASWKKWLKLCRNQAFKISFAWSLWFFQIELSKKGFGEKMHPNFLTNSPNETSLLSLEIDTFDIFWPLQWETFCPARND